MICLSSKNSAASGSCRRVSFSSFSSGGRSELATASLQMDWRYTLSVTGQIGASENGDNFVAAFLDVCAAAFFSVHQHDDESDASAGFFDRVYCLNSRSAG